MAPSGRGGYGGGNNISKMGGKDLPFEIDADLEAQVAELKDDDSELFPEFALPFPDPPTAREKKSVAAYKKIRDARRAGPFYADLETTPIGTKRSAEAAFDPFEDAPTYGKTLMKKPRNLPDFSKVKLDKSLFPKELWDTIDPQGKGDSDGAAKKKLPQSGKSLTDKLAEFDDDTDGAEETAGEEEIDETNDNDVDDEDAPAEPQDDNFEDDEDEHDDYNAEQYFDGGEDDHEEAAGDDGAGGEECDIVDEKSSSSEGEEETSLEERARVLESLARDFNGRRY